MDERARERLREHLVGKRHELTAKLQRIQDSLRRGLDPDSAERAKQLEDAVVVDTLGREARLELQQIADALRRMDEGRFGICASCGSPIGDARLQAYPYATECIDCATAGEARRVGS